MHAKAQKPLRRKEIRIDNIEHCTSTNCSSQTLRLRALASLREFMRFDSVSSVPQWWIVLRLAK